MDFSEHLVQVRNEMEAQLRNTCNMFEHLLMAAQVIRLFYATLMESIAVRRCLRIEACISLF